MLVLGTLQFAGFFCLIGICKFQAGWHPFAFAFGGYQAASVLGFHLSIWASTSLALLASLDPGGHLAGGYHAASVFGFHLAVWASVSLALLASLVVTLMVAILQLALLASLVVTLLVATLQLALLAITLLVRHLLL